MNRAPGAPQAERSLKVLVVDDEPETAAAHRDFIARVDGYWTGAVAGNGQQALALIESGTFELLLTDIVMPGMDGIALAQAAQRLAEPPRIMFITGFAAVALQANDELPEARVLSKPFHLKDLVRQVEAEFAEARAGGF